METNIFDKTSLLSIMGSLHQFWQIQGQRASHIRPLIIVVDNCVHGKDELQGQDREVNYVAFEISKNQYVV